LPLEYMWDSESGGQKGIKKGNNCKEGEKRNKKNVIGLTQELEIGHRERRKN